MGEEYNQESALIIQLQNDDVKAFDKIYSKYHQAIYKNIFKLLKDRDEAENILQEVFIALWTNRAKLKPDKPVANWLFVVSYNKSLTQLKKNLKAALTLTPINDNFEYEAEVDGFLKEARLQLIDEACLNLSPQKKKVFDLCKIQGKTYEETALELNISKYTVKEYLGLAVKSIKEYVDKHPDKQMMGVYLIVLMKAIYSK